MRFYGYFYDEHRIYLITEYCHDGDLFSRLTKLGKIPEKEAAIVWVREILMYIRKRGTEAMYYAVNDEWMRILDPRYDVRWFTGGAKVEAWRKEMLEIAAKL